MKKHIKLIVFIASLLTIFLIYKGFEYKQDKIFYIALGDSVAEGMNSYGAIGYGYTDYVSEYLDKNDRLDFYIKGFAKSGYTIENVKNDIDNNKTIEVDGKKVNIKEALRESDLVTISIGANDFIKGLTITNVYSKIENLKQSKKEIDQIGENLKELIELIKDYANNEIILLGYYNPLPRLKVVKEEIDELVKYSNYMYEKICDDYEITYIDIFDIFDGNEDLLPNSLDIHPNTKGYEKIADKIIKEVD